MKRKFSEKSLRSGDAHSIAASGVSGQRRKAGVYHRNLAGSRN